MWTNNRSRNRKQKGDGIGIGRIRRVCFSSDSDSDYDTYDPVWTKGSESESESEDLANDRAHKMTIELIKVNKKGRKYWNEIKSGRIKQQKLIPKNISLSRVLISLTRLKHLPLIYRFECAVFTKQFLVPDFNLLCRRRLKILRKRTKVGGLRCYHPIFWISQKNTIETSTKPRLTILIALFWFTLDRKLLAILIAIPIPTLTTLVWTSL